jgi:repressor LexA
MKGLTQKQRDILKFIQDFIQIHQYSPSYREIMEHFAFSSPGSVYKHIRTLQRKGVLTAEKQCSRSLMPLEPLPAQSIKSGVDLPFIGHIMAGCPIEMFIQTQTLTIPELLVPAPDKTYILRAQGDSLHDEGILDGDLVLVEARQEAHAGETVLALINQHDTVIKHYYPEGQYIRLEGRNPQHQPLILRYDSLLIQGVLVGLMRTY